MNIIIGGELRDRELLEQIEELGRVARLTFIDKYLSLIHISEPTRPY